MESPATYLQIGFVSISVPNLLVVLAMIGAFVAALLLPFPRHRVLPSTTRSAAASPDAETVPEVRNWTTRVRGALSGNWPWHQLLPDRQPAFVASWMYLFGVVAIAALVWIIGSGVILVFFGPTWWHVNSTGRLVNSIHFWSVQLFFISMVLHLWGQYFMAGWRHGRARTWMVGVVIFAISIVAGFTGYVSQQNFDAQWIALNAKDAVNSIGLGSFINVLDYGQMFGIHVMLLPALVVGLIGVHVLLVRRKGVVRPISQESEVAAIVDSEGGKS
jgi:quinol-cytochrome oxidoreductase complex cytochrome b subunit